MLHVSDFKKLKKVSKRLNSFGHDFLDLVEGRRAGHLGKYEYANGLVKLWSKFIEKNPAYYVPHEEESLIKRAAEVSANLLLSKNVRNITLVSYGPGTKFEHKEGELIKAFKKAGINISKVVYFDKYKSALNKSAKEGKQILPNAIHEKVQGDIFDPDFKAKYKIVGTEVAACFGLTPMNAEGFAEAMPPVAAIEKNLESLRGKMSKKSHFIATYDHNTDKDSIERSYAGRSEHAKGLLKKNLGWNDDALQGVDFVVRYNPRSYIAAHGFHFNKDKMFKLSDERLRHIKSGITLWFQNSVKLPKELTQEVHENVGFEYLLPQKAETYEGNRMGYHHMVKK